MQKLLESLAVYETEKITFSVYELSRLLKNTSNKNIVNIIASMINEKMNIDIKGDEKFTLFYFIKNKEYPIIAKREDFNNLKTKILPNPDLKPLKDSLLKIQNSNNIRIKDYSIDIYFFINEQKYILTKFNKILLQISEKLMVNEEFDKNYFPSVPESIGTFFIDSFNFFSKRVTLFIIIFSIYFIYYYKMMLETIGFVDDIIDLTYILSILKLFTTVIIPLLSIAVIVIAPFLYIMFHKESKKSFYNILKSIISLCIYFLILLVMTYSHNIFNIKKKYIDLDNSFLNLYISERFYPRFIENGNSLDLVLDKKGKELFYYTQDKLKLDNDETCSNINDENFDKIVISTLKSSDNIGSKFINRMNINKKIKILDKNETFKKFVKLCNKKEHN